MDREEQNKLLDTGIRLKDDFLDLEMQDLANVINSLACPRENASRDLLGSRGRYQMSLSLLLLMCSVDKRDLLGSRGRYHLNFYLNHASRDLLSSCRRSLVYRTH